MNTPHEAIPDCARCNDTGNDPSTGYQHPGFDELGCPLCDGDAASLCCDATPDASGEKCARCGHPVEKVQEATA